MSIRANRVLRFPACALALFAVVAVNRWLLPVNGTTAALYMFLVVLGAAARWGLPESIFTSIGGVLIFNFFFLPPVGTFTISDPQNWAALFAFLVTAVTASQLSYRARRRAEEALAGRNEIARLYDLSRGLLMDEGRDVIRDSVVRAGQVLQIGSLAFFDSKAKQVYGTVEGSRLSPADLERVAETGEQVTAGGTVIIPVRLGSQPIGSIALPAGKLSPQLADSVANLLAINYERAHALERAATAEIARRNEEFKSALLDGLAHDLKTPLTAIRTCVTRLITIPPRTEERRLELLNIIDQESTRLQTSITEAIELARIESRELQPQIENVNVRSILDAALAGVRDENRARYSVDAPVDFELRVDPDLLRRAILQILENSRKYTAPDSPIRIEAREAGPDGSISVLDRGPGIDPEDIIRVFDKFYRGRRGRDRVEGSGMGLSIAKGIVEAHGGTICAQNRTGGGAAIRISLPITVHRS